MPIDRSIPPTHRGIAAHRTGQLVRSTTVDIRPSSSVVVTMGCAPSSSSASAAAASATATATTDVGHVEDDVVARATVADDDDGGVGDDDGGVGEDDGGARRMSHASRVRRGRADARGRGGAHGSAASGATAASGAHRRTGSGRSVRGTGAGGVATTTSGTVLRSPPKMGGGGGDWSVHRGQAMGDVVVGAGRLERDCVDGRKAVRLSSDARWSAGGGGARAEEDQTTTKVAFTGARANVPASPPSIGARSYAQKRAWHKRTMSEDPNTTPSAFGRWALGSSKFRGGPRRSETTVHEGGGVEHYAGGDVAGAGTHRSAHGGGMQDVIKAMRERQSFVRQLTVETIRLCRPMCELEPSINALIRLKAIDREAAARVQTRLDADAHPSGAFDGKLQRANSSTSTSPNVAVAKTGLTTKGPALELSLDDVEAELVSVQRLIQ